jgi:4-amino-4-deoxy-L-arabinose transferase-like glycosyltransferase
MDQAARDRGFAIAAAVVALAALVAFATTEPIDHGYIRYAGLADEVVRSGDWIALRLSDEIYVHKPPLFVWLIALPMALVGGDTGWVQHAPNLVALALTVLFSQRLARRLFGRSDAAWLVALLLLTTVEILTLLRDKRIDPLFGALLLAAFDGFHLAWTAAERGDRPGARRGWLAAGAWLALAVLAKGPLALPFFALPVLTLALWERRARALACREAFLGGVAFATLVAIWPALLVRELGAEATLAALRAADLVTRGGDILHYVANLPLQLAPWTVFAPALVLHLRRDALAPAARPAWRFLGSWLVPSFVMLHLSSARHTRYLLPLFPPLCLALATLWFEPGGARRAALGAAATRWRDGATQLALALFAAAAVVGVVASPFLGVAGAAVAPVAALAGLGALDGLRGFRRGGAAEAAALRLALVGLLAIAAWDGARAVRFAAHDPVDAARAALAPARAGGPVLALALNEGPGALVPMILGRTVERTPDPSDAAAWLRSHSGSSRWIVAPAEIASALGAEPGLGLRASAPFELDGDDLLVLEAGPDR